MHIRAWDDRSMPDEVTYTRHIAPILAANCAECHRDRSVAPFPLETYDQAKRRARMIALVTSQKIMPPWPAEKGHGSFRDERHLSQRQIEALDAWAADGAPKGADEEALSSTELGLSELAEGRA